MVAASTSKFSKHVYDTDGATMGAASTYLLMNSDGLVMDTPRVEDEGMRGTRARNVARITQGLTPVGGPLVAEPTPIELDFWLPFVLGGTKSVNSIPTAEALTAYSFGCLRATTSGANKWFQYNGCVCASMQLESSPGQKLGITANIIGKTETANASTFPAPTVAYDAAAPYMHHNLVCTIGGSVSGGTLTGGTTYTPERVGVTIDNGIQPAYRNSQTASDLTARDRIVTVDLLLPFTSTEYSLYAATKSAFACSLVWSYGNVSLSMVFPALIAQARTPAVPGGTGEIMLAIQAMAYKSGNENEIQVSNDSTP